MRIIKIHKRSYMEVEKSDGETDDIRNAFPGDDETQREMINEVQVAEEIEEQEKDNQERMDAESILQGHPEEYEEVEIQHDEDAIVDPSGGEINVMNEVASHLMSGKDMVIDYTTKSGYDITRTVTPKSVFMANSTGNQILLTMTHEWGDYRAYIINNIRDIKNIEDTQVNEDNMEYYL